MCNLAHQQNAGQARVISEPGPDQIGIDVARKNFNEQVTKPGWRPVRLALTADEHITSVYEGTFVGTGAIVFGQTADELYTELF
jgi:hypothetical protein